MDLGATGDHGRCAGLSVAAAGGWWSCVGFWAADCCICCAINHPPTNLPVIYCPSPLYGPQFSPFLICVPIIYHLILYHLSLCVYIYMCVCFLVHVPGLHRGWKVSGILFNQFPPVSSSQGFFLNSGLFISLEANKYQQLLLTSPPSKGLKTFLWKVWLIMWVLVFWLWYSWLWISCAGWFNVCLTHWTLIETMPPTDWIVDKPDKHFLGRWLI